MTLVPREFVASQGKEAGVLVPTKFAGAAGSMREALLVNPFDIDATAGATYQALRMRAAEPVRR